MIQLVRALKTAGVLENFTHLAIMSPGGGHLEGDGRPRQLADRAAKRTAPPPARRNWPSQGHFFCSRGKHRPQNVCLRAFHCTTDETLKSKCIKESEG